MRRISAASLVALGIGSVTILAGCSSNGFVGPSSTIPSTTQSHQSRALPDRTGLAPGAILSTILRQPVRENFEGPFPPGLFVSEFSGGTGDVDVLKNGTYTHVITITNGINFPDGNWVDAKGIFYTTNVQGKNVTEYAKGNISVGFTYSTALGDPITVTTDHTGANVFVGDYNLSQNGFVNQYKHKSNAVLHTCGVGGGVEGVAVDHNGDVFVAYNLNSGANGAIVKFAHGLSGCHQTALGATVAFAGGMVLDKHHNLILVDQTAHTVDVIKPPYSTVSTTFSVPTPFRVGLSKGLNQRLFVSEPGSADVKVLKYPSGTLITTLGSSSGLTTPYGVTDYPNSIP